jgi:hypothetical protein
MAPVNPREEAFDRLDGRYEVRVLEPSPPASARPPWFADDPVARGDAPANRLVVSPLSTGDLLWEELARDDGDLAAWCSERWLAAHPRLAPAPENLQDTRRDLHLLAEHVISPTRQRANERIGLRWTRGGFGTPFFGNDVQVRVRGDELVVQVGRRVQAQRLTTLMEAAEFVGFDVTRFDAASEERVQAVDPDASRFLGDVFGFATSVLEQLRAEAAPELEPGRVQLWPEHFDVALELGAENEGRRAAYGVSPGDDEHPEPYLYVAPWGGGLVRELQHAELAAATDQRALALAFFRDALR